MRKKEIKRVRVETPYTTFLLEPLNLQMELLTGLRLCDIFRNACRRGDLELCKNMLKDYSLAKLEIASGLDSACARNQVAIVKELLRADSGLGLELSVPFVIACVNNSVEVMQTLLDVDDARKVDVHFEDDQALRLGCQESSYDGVRLLLAQTDSRRVSDLNVKKALAEAMRSQSDAICDLLLKELNVRKITPAAETAAFFVEEACTHTQPAVAAAMMRLGGSNRVRRRAIHGNDTVLSHLKTSSLRIFVMHVFISVLVVPPKVFSMYYSF